jgi:hypothetical protein
MHSIKLHIVLPLLAAKKSHPTGNKVLGNFCLCHPKTPETKMDANLSGPPKEFGVPKSMRG